MKEPIQKIEFYKNTHFQIFFIEKNPKQLNVHYFINYFDDIFTQLHTSPTAQKNVNAV